MKRNIGFIVALLGILAVFFIFNNTTKTSTSAITNITSYELQEKLASKKDDKEFIDVREPDEYEYGHVKGFKNFPLTTLKENYPELPKDKEIIIICRSGRRSMEAAEILKGIGYQKITNVEGGIISWNGEIEKGSSTVPIMEKK